VAAGGKLGFGVGLRGKTGLDLPEATFEVQVAGPPGAAQETVATARERDGQRGTFWKTSKPGEYRITVKASGKDADNTIVTGEATARFLVYQDETEMLRQAMDEDFLKKLATAGGGKFYRADELPKFLHELASKGLAAGQNKARYWPDWRSPKLGGFVPILFLLFVLVLGLEWGLRRHWGMV
jgi:surface-anchored protein